ncbi:hypothetical protein E0H80_06165 [Acinetobacter sp. ANC 4779]|uniref:host specificity factor TipJ family phage tail protein n=1 Tax=Acinetobacter sp. ANC 4779 TaxID=2529848 RepID=UPI00103B5887|nr:host specificity factor TipJ family phage tail protein [Acinetobacter sp. ANC 4779]TCB50951.1 hypothetical protein E0H80_06165 [Acinetobacter sp. ANC 4779]
MKRVHIRRDPFNKETWTVEDVEDICAYLSEQFTAFPDNARIYHGAVAQKNDVTPIDERSIRHLQSLEGEFYVVVYGAVMGWDDILIWAVVAISAAFSIYTYMTMPKPQVSAPQSSNNDLASRQNQARLNGRVPEILGKLRAVPDLIAPPATFFNELNQEIEECVMVIGRGYYQIHDCKEDQTNANDISGIAVSAYDPHTSITGAPIFQIGDGFTEPPLLTLKSKSINGQTLNVPNDQKVESAEIYFQFPNLIKTNSPYINFDELFDQNDSIGIYGAEFLIDDAVLAGNTILTTENQLIINSAVDISGVSNFHEVILSGALIKVTTEVSPVPPETESAYVENYYDLSGRYKVTHASKTAIPGGFSYLISLRNAQAINPNWQYVTQDYTVGTNIRLTDNSGSINLNGTYIIEAVSVNEIKLSNPDLLNSDWVKVNFTPDQNTQSQPLVVRLDKLNNSWVGWYNLDLENTEELIFNFFFQNGLFYQDSKGGVWSDQMTALIEYQYISETGQPAGNIYQQYFSISAASKSAFGTTRRIALAHTGKVRFRIARTTPTKNDKTQDLTKIRDVYAASRSKILNYGDVTVVRSRTLGTDGALSLKERKLNMLVTRKLPVNGTGALTPTRSAAQAFIYLALDSKNGRRKLSEVDVAQILAEEQEVIHYFNNPKAAEFSYTIDDENLAFEEIAGMIASACFSEPTRFGSKLRLHFEQPKNTPVLLFNHRNKVPKSEKRTYSFGINKDYDGIEFEYTSPDDDARVTYLIPPDGSAKNPMSIKSSGIRTEEQAKTRAWREWNKLFYQRVSCKFDALDESNLLARNDPILIADNVKVKTQDGEVETVNGLTLDLSQSVEILAGDSIYLQMPDGTVDLIGCQKGTESNQIILNRAPLLPLVVENDRYVKTTYQIVRAGEASKSMFVLTEMTPQSKMTNSLTCVNYDSRYYEKDHAFF